MMGIARQEAQRLRSEYIASEHILIALLSKAEFGSVKLLRHVGIDIAALRSEFEKVAPSTDRQGLTLGQLPISPDGAQLMVGADQVSRTLKYVEIATFHFLLADLDEPEGVLRRVLPRLGLDPADLRRRMADALAGARE